MVISMLDYLVREVEAKTMTTNEKIAARIVQLKRLSKAELIEKFPSRLDKSHLRSEPKWSILCEILEAEFGRKALRDYDAR